MVLAPNHNRCSTPRNRIQETAISVPFVPGFRFLAFDFGVGCRNVRFRDETSTWCCRQTLLPDRTGACTGRGGDRPNTSGRGCWRRRRRTSQVRMRTGMRDPSSSGSGRGSVCLAWRWCKACIQARLSTRTPRCSTPPAHRDSQPAPPHTPCTRWAARPAAVQTDQDAQTLRCSPTHTALTHSSPPRGCQPCTRATRHCAGASRLHTPHTSEARPRASQTLLRKARTSPPARLRTRRCTSSCGHARSRSAMNAPRQGMPCRRRAPRGP
mmetsp:Transcript_58350/g.119332  ORF Transcript_58350/g.119332 Transcript_58350/m.119332 type:complete len:268 (-) Transcript_58350:176-979(-)